MRFHFPEKDCITVVNNEAVRRKELCVEENDGFVIVNAVAENDGAGKYIQPVFGVIGVKNNVLSVYGELQLTDWGTGDCDVDFDLTPSPLYTPPKALAQAVHSFGGGDFTATVYFDGKNNLLLETRGKTARFILPCDVTSPEVLFQPTNVGFLTVLTAACNKGEYLMLITYGGEFTKIFEVSAEKITYTPHSFTVTENLADMLGRRRVSTYTFSGTKTNTPEISFTYAHDKIYPEILTPYLLAEAVKAGDNARARTYLSSELSEDVSSLSDFFGDFEKISYPKYRMNEKKDSLKEVALLYPRRSPVEKAKIFVFSMENGLITNISD